MVPKRETSGLRLDVNSKGRLSLSVNDKKVPAFAISVDGGSRDARGFVRVDIPSMFVTFVNVDGEPEDDAPAPPPERTSIRGD